MTDGTKTADLLDKAATGVITESAVRVILHCSRCNTPFKDDEYDGVDDGIVLWTQEELTEAFPVDFCAWTDVQGWVRLGDRILCFDCWEYEDEDTDDEVRCEKSPLPAADADRVTREQLAYQEQRAEVEQLHNLQAVIDRLQEWTTSDVVTARSSFGDGYREAIRDVRDILAGLNGGER